MKSRKLRTVLATLSAIAVLATAMTGFAATVTTTTEYHANSDYAHVISTVTGANGEVTYLATTTDGMGVNSSGILYIDQKTAEGASITFDYYVAKSAINGTDTTVQLGTNGTEEIDDAGQDLEIKAIADVNEEDYTITYGADYYGNSDGSVTAVISAKSGYEIEAIKINGVAQPIGEASYSVPVVGGSLATVEVETKDAYVAPSLDVAETTIGTDDKGNNTITTILKPVGSWTEVGVKYYGFEFPATGALNGNGYVAVKLVDDDPIVEAEYETYYK